MTTAIKPLLLLQLLDDTDQAIYLDPDTYLASPMLELVPAEMAQLPVSSEKYRYSVTDTGARIEFLDADGNVVPRGRDTIGAQ